MEHDSRHIELFRQEASELLAEIEDTVLDIEQNPEDKESINRLFRSMHTIKGSGAMFGFERLAAFVHHIETLLDQVREGRVQVTSELIDLVFMAKDRIKAMLDQSFEDCRIDSSACNMIVARLDALMHGAGDSCLEQLQPENITDPELSINNKTQTAYQIQFHPNRDIMASGMNPCSILNELRDLGQCEITAHTEKIPNLKELDPEKCFLFWNIILKTEHNIDVIKDVFMFIEEESDISINPLEHDLTSDSQKQAETIIPDKEKSAPPDHNITEQNITEQKIIEKHKPTITQENIKIASEKLDKLINLVGELVINQATLVQAEENNEDTEFSAPVKRMERLIGDLRDITLNMRMLPVGNIFSRFKRLVRDLSCGLGKEIDLVIEGGETELDKTIVERLHDPLIHLVRNSIDHGISPPEERERSGKPRKGTLKLSAAHQGARVNITISDDGMGIDTEKVLSKAMEKGIILKKDNLTETEIFDLIFAPGFSTASQVTDVSGRGVGMDVVKREISALGGTISITSTPGKGTSVHLSMPLTLAIIEGLLVKTGDRDFIFPVSQIRTCMEMKRFNIDKANERNMLWMKGDLIPFVRLRDVFKIPGNKPDEEHVATFNNGNYNIGIIVDEIAGNIQTVIKPLDRLYRHAKGISGATILGNGKVALIVDLPALVNIAKITPIGAKNFSPSQPRT